MGTVATADATMRKGSVAAMPQRFRPKSIANIRPITNAKLQKKLGIGKIDKFYVPLRFE